MFLPKTLKDYFNDNPLDLIGTKCVVNGWVKSMRVQSNGTLLFIDLQDGTTHERLQCIASSEEEYKDDNATFTDLASTIKTGTSLRIEGVFVESPAAGQKFELKIHKIDILGNVLDDYLLQKHSSKEKGVTLDRLRQDPHIRCRAPVFQSIFRVRDRLMRSTHAFFNEHNFVWATTPLITFSDCEGAGEAFAIKALYSKEEMPNGEFFGKPASLTVSGQLEGEMLAAAHSRVYTFGITCRAEKSKTSRHLSEFWMIEPEVCFITLPQLMDLAEYYVKRCIFDVLEHNAEDIKQTLLTSMTDANVDQKKIYDLRRQRMDELINLTRKNTPFVRVSYTDAIRLLVKHQKDHFNKTKTQLFEEVVEWGIDMSSEHEKYLTDVIYKSPTIVHSYPAKIKSFYMKRYDPSRVSYVEEAQCVQAFDLLMPGLGELIGGSIREESYDKLLEVMNARGMDIDAYKHYLDLRLYGSVPHGGFGLGFERLVKYVTGIHHIQDTIPFPRSY